MGSSIEISEFNDLLSNKEFNRYYENGAKNIFIESGTLRGVTSKRMSSYFDLVYTIEISVGLYFQFLKKLNKEKKNKSEVVYENINAYLGDTRNVLKKILIDKHVRRNNVTFFLDAHAKSVSGKPPIIRNPLRNSDEKKIWRKIVRRNPRVKWNWATIWFKKKWQTGIEYADTMDTRESRFGMPLFRNDNNKNKVPLISELKLIKTARQNQQDIIIIDDVRLFGTKRKDVDWKKITKEKIFDVLGKNTFSFEHNDRLIILTNWNGEHL